MQRRLRARSYYAIRGRARTLGVAARRHVWTNPEVKTLQALYLRGATCAQVVAAFPAQRFNEVAAVMLRRTAGPLSHDRNLHSEGGRER